MILQTTKNILDITIKDQRWNHRNVSQHLTSHCFPQISGKSSSKFLQNHHPGLVEDDFFREGFLHMRALVDWKICYFYPEHLGNDPILTNVYPTGLKPQLDNFGEFYFDTNPRDPTNPERHEEATGALCLIRIMRAIIRSVRTLNMYNCVYIIVYLYI